MSATTRLVIEGISLTPYSALGLTQTLDPIEMSSSLMRTVDGALDDLSLSQFQKYRSTISCNHFDAPALDGVFPGKQVVVHCIVELAYPIPTGDDEEDEPGDNANRTPVTGSIRVKDGFVRYRPKLTMRVVSYTVSRDEFGASTAWTLVLEEV